MANIRIKDQTTDTVLAAGDYVIVDNATEGTRKFDLGQKLVDIDDDFTDVKQDLQDIIDHGTGGGMSAEFKQALHNILEKVAYVDEYGQTYLDALDDAMYPPVTAINLNTNSLSFASLNSTQQLTATTTPTGGSVTWSSSNTSIATVSSTGLVTSIGYGSATITVTSGSVSATCSVTVAQATLVSISAVYTQSGTVYNTDNLDSLKSDLVVTATWSDSSTSTVASADYTLSGTLVTGTSTITVSYEEKTTTFDVVVTSGSLQRYLNINDIVETRGFSGISVSNLGNVTYNASSTFSVFAINPTLFPIRIQPYINLSGNTYPIIFKEENGHYYGIDNSGATAKTYEFNYNNGVFSATNVTGITSVTKEGTISRDNEFVATLENGELVLTYENGKVTISNANIFGFWASTTNIILPEECEVNYGSV